VRIFATAAAKTRVPCGQDHRRIRIAGRGNQRNPLDIFIIVRYLCSVNPSF
jgi:hypothetical protein